MITNNKKIPLDDDRVFKYFNILSNESKYTLNPKTNPNLSIYDQTKEWLCSIAEVRIDIIKKYNDHWSDSMNLETEFEIDQGEWTTILEEAGIFYGTLSFPVDLKTNPLLEIYFDNKLFSSITYTSHHFPDDVIHEIGYAMITYLDKYDDPHFSDFHLNINTTKIESAPPLTAKTVMGSEPTITTDPSMDL